MRKENFFPVKIEFCGGWRFSFSPVQSGRAELAEKILFTLFVSDSIPPENTGPLELWCPSMPDGTLVATIPLSGPAGTFIQADLTSYCKKEGLIPGTLVLTGSGDDAFFWFPDRDYPFFSPRIELYIPSPNRQELLTILQEEQSESAIIYPPNVDWNTPLFQRPHQLLRSFAGQGYLSFFMTPNILFDKYPPGFHRLEEKLYLANVPMDTFNTVSRPAVLINSPLSANYLLHLISPLVIFDYIDELNIFYMYDERMEIAGRYLLKNAAVVAATAARLWSKAREFRPDSLYCPNGVDFDHFSRATRRPEKAPGDFRSIIKKKKPVIGYYGALAKWVDYGLLKYLAEKRKDYQIVLIGWDYDGSLKKSGLLKKKNAFYLGPKDYQVLPDYLAFFDVATIPFKINEITLSTNPIKMYEYMAAGKPAVTTSLPECALTPGVLAAAGRKEFLHYIDHALKQKKDTIITSLVKTASENTWDERAKQIIKDLNHRLGTGID